MWGTADRLFPIDDARRLAREFPRARLTEVPHSRAYVMIDAAPQVADAIRETVTAS